MVLGLDEALQEQLRHWARQGYPHECCGLLLGSAATGRVRVDEVLAARNLNIERAQDRFELDPQDFMRADALARGRGLEIVGIWHTHPDHPACPSATDLENAWEGWSYLILSVSAQGVQALRSWRLAGRAFVEESIE